LAFAPHHNKTINISSFLRSYKVNTLGYFFFDSRISKLLPFPLIYGSKRLKLLAEGETLPGRNRENPAMLKAFPFIIPSRGLKPPYNI